MRSPIFVAKSGCFFERGYKRGYGEGLHFWRERGYKRGYIFQIFGGVSDRKLRGYRLQVAVFEVLEG